MAEVFSLPDKAANPGERPRQIGLSTAVRESEETILLLNQPAIPYLIAIRLDGIGMQIPVNFHRDC
jgi:hypothetical protein